MESMTTSEITFDVYKADFQTYWDELDTFKLLYCPEYDCFYEIYININISSDVCKVASASSLGVAELSQILLHEVEINTEDDIARDDYEATTIYNPSNPKASLLDRILDKAPHYDVAYVSPTLAGLQRTFSFDKTSIYDALIQISEEIDCLVDVHCSVNNDYSINRSIRLYDLESYCSDCGRRGVFTDTCPYCGSTNIIRGYGDDTTIFVTPDNLADTIEYTVNADAVKNCFKIGGGDDLMTATIINCNPNGSAYIWYLPESIRKDMSTELQEALANYDGLYEYYQNEYVYTPTSSVRTAYNNLVTKYVSMNDALTPISQTLTGYPEIMQAYYNAIDFELYLQSTMMPDTSLPSTTASDEGGKLTTASLSPVAVTNLSACSEATASNAVLGMARVIVDARYQVKTTDTSYAAATHTWTGAFVVTSYSDEDDTYTTPSISVVINDDYENYVKQKIDKLLNKESPDVGIEALFKLTQAQFATQLTLYCLDSLSNIEKCCQGAVDVLIEQGIADDDASWGEDLYTNMYIPYYNKLSAIQSEMALRESEILTITGAYDEYGNITTDGMQTVLMTARESIRSTLSFDDYLGADLWEELAAYRREDVYTNDNYISDGLTTAEIFDYAVRFIEEAEKEIVLSATNQHSITATLKNLLTMKEFHPILDYFQVGNWLRVDVDGDIYVLRLLQYEIDYENLDNISVTFSDVKSNGDDLASIISSASSMASSYAAITRQAEKGDESARRINDWVDKGLSLTTSKIVNSADNQNVLWDSHGILLREYSSIIDDYEDEQLKIINRGLYVTDDGWHTAKAGIGNFFYYDPADGQTKQGFGVIADKLVANLILGQNVGIYNTAGSVVIDENGLTITADGTSGDNDVAFTIAKTTSSGTQNILYVDSNGDLVGRFNNLTITGTGGNVPTSSDVSSAITTYDSSLNQLAVFNKLTNNGTVEGIYMSDISGDTNLYIDASYIQAGTLDAARIRTGTITVSHLDNNAKSSIATGTTTKNQYYLSTSDSSATGGSWSDAVSAWSPGMYVWTRVATTVTKADNTSATSYSAAVYDANLTTALATSENAQNDIDNLSVGGRNLIWRTLNPKISGDTTTRPSLNGMTSLLLYGGSMSAATHGARAIATSATRTYMRLGSTAAASGSLYGLEPGETYTLSFDSAWKMLSANTNTTTYYNRVYLYTDAATTGTFAQTEFHNFGTIKSADRGVDMTGRCEYTFTVPVSATMLYFSIGSNRTTASDYAVGDYLEVSNLKLEKGNRATDWTPAPEDIANTAAAREQLIYISAVSGTSSMSGTTTWVTLASDAQNTWTTKRPTYNGSYPVLFVATQKQAVDGTITCTTPIKDDTTTVIDGGHITTGSIDASVVTVTNLNANEISSGTMSANHINGGTIDANNVTITNLDASNINTGILTSIAIQNGTPVNGVYPFSVDASGHLTATGASINGSVTTSNDSFSVTLSNGFVQFGRGYITEYLSPRGLSIHADQLFGITIGSSLKMQISDTKSQFLGDADIGNNLYVGGTIYIGSSNTPLDDYIRSIVN